MLSMYKDYYPEESTQDSRRPKRVNPRSDCAHEFIGHLWQHKWKKTEDEQLVWKRMSGESLFWMEHKAPQTQVHLRPEKIPYTYFIPYFLQQTLFDRCWLNINEAQLWLFSQQLSVVFFFCLFLFIIRFCFTTWDLRRSFTIQAYCL